MKLRKRSEFSPSDFKKVSQDQKEDLSDPTGPTVSPGAQIWFQLEQNSRAVCALFVLILIVLFSLLGPLLWRVDPTIQNLHRISEPPSISKRAVVISDASPTTDGSIQNVKALTVIGIPSTVRVLIAWPPYAKASGGEPGGGERSVSFNDNSYRISKLQKGMTGEPFLLGETSDNYFDDRMNLIEGDFEYFVQYSDGQVQSIPVHIVYGIPSEDAALLDAKVKVGDEVRLKAHPFGTDYLGRDLLARIMKGARISLLVGILAPLLYTLIGIVIGGLAGYIGGMTDNFLLGLMNVVSSLPFLLFTILFKIAMGIGPGESGVSAIIVALMLLSWSSAARLVRGQALQLRELEYVQAAKILGAGTFYVVRKHIIPNTLGVIIVYFTLAIPSTIFVEAFLSFIGMGVVPPAMSLGTLCQEGMHSFFVNPYELIFPSVFISVTILSFNILGYGLRDVLDPKTRFKR